MAKINTKLLLAIAGAMAVAPGYLFVSTADAKPLVDAKLAEQNGEIKDANGALATRLTDAGMAEAQKNGYTAEQPATPAQATSKPTFEIRTGVSRPRVSRGGGEGSGSKYPFDSLPQDGAFFIPITGDAKTASKSFGSLVSAANKKYGTQNDFRRFTTRTMDGAPFDQPGVKGVGIFRLSAEEEAAAKAKAFPAAGQQPG